jgi:hypothetical protein
MNQGGVALPGFFPLGDGRRRPAWLKASCWCSGTFLLGALPRWWPWCCQVTLELVLGLHCIPIQDGCNTLNFEFPKLAEIMHSHKNLLRLHCMHNSFPKPSPISMSGRMSKFFYFKYKFWVRILIHLIEFPYSLIWVSNQFWNSISKIFQTLSSNSFDLNPWPLSKFLTLRNFKKFIQN